MSGDCFVVLNLKGELGVFLLPVDLSMFECIEEW